MRTQVCGIAVLTLGFLSVAPTFLATERPEADANRLCKVMVNLVKKVERSSV